MADCTKVVVRPGVSTTVSHDSKVSHVSVVRYPLSQIVTTQSSSSVITHADRSQVLITAGKQGVPGRDGVMSRPQVEEIIRETLHADAAEDGVTVDAQGNIRLTFGTLPALP